MIFNRSHCDRHALPHVPDIGPEAVQAVDTQYEAPAGLLTRNVTDGAGEPLYRILISRPQGPAPATGYPALLLLDGHVTAPLAYARLAARARVNRVLIVGVDRPLTHTSSDDQRRWRYRHLAPIAVAGWPDSGQAEGFLDFLTHQLIIYLAEHYPLDAARRMLLGHSLGGLAVLMQLTRDTRAFSHYAAISPSFWWANERFKRLLSAFATQHPQLLPVPRQVLVGVGRDEQPISASAKSKLNTTRLAKLAHRRMVDNAMWAADLLTCHSGLEVTQYVMDNADHAAARTRALYWVLDNWL